MVEHTAQSQADSQFAPLKLHHLVKGAGLLFVCRLAARILGYAFNIIAAKQIGLKEFGIYTLGLTVLRFVQIDPLGSRSGAVVRYVSMYHALGDQARLKGTIQFVLKNTALLSVLTATGLFVFSDLLAMQVFHQPPLSEVLTRLAFALPFISCSAVFLLATVGVHIMAFRALTKDVFEPFVLLGVFLLLVHFGMTLHACTYAYLCAAILGCAVAYYCFAKTFTPLIASPLFRQREHADIRPVCDTKAIVRFTLPLVGARIFTKLRKRADILLLALFVPADQIGLYTIIYKTVETLTDISASLIGVFSPRVSALYEQGALAALKSQLQILSKWNFSLSFPIVLFAFFHAQSILSVLGDEFTTGHYSFIALLFGILCEMITAPTSDLLTMAGKSQILLLNTIGAGTLNLVLFVICIPPYGIEGASSAVAVSLFLLSLARVVEGHKILGVHPFTWKYLKPALAACLTLGFTLGVDQLLPTQRYWFLAGSFTTFLAGYLAALCLLGLDSEDRFILEKMKERLCRPSTSNVAAS
jgi:O-antigen/teichoic acid export membrane protein